MDARVEPVDDSGASRAETVKHLLLPRRCVNSEGIAGRLGLPGQRKLCGSSMFQNLTYLADDHGWSLAVLVSMACCLCIVCLIATFGYRRLREQKLCLDTAINNMIQGLTMFDKSGRLTLCNRRYIEMYGLSPDVVRPGCTVRQLIDHRIETGSLTAGDAESYVNLRRAAVMQDKTVSNVVE